MSYPKRTRRFVLFAGLLSLSTHLASAQLVINEVMASNRKAVEHHGNYSDWIEIYNPTTTNIDIGGWYIRNVEDNGSRISTNLFRFPSATSILADERLIVWCDSATNSPGWHTRFPLDRTGGTLALLRANFSFVPGSSVSFGLQLTDRSVGRVPDGLGGFTLTVPTPGGTNVAQPLASVSALRINEWAAANTVSQCNSDIGYEGAELVCPDWLELYNSAYLPVPLQGVIVTDTILDPTYRWRYHAFTNLSFIEGNGFQKLVADDHRKPGNHLNFALSSMNGETLRIYAPDEATIVDEISFPGNSQIPGYWPGDISYGRFPDGGSIDLRTFVTPTPGEPNFHTMTNVIVNEVLANNAPPFEDAIEIANMTAEGIVIGGWWLTDEKDHPKKFRIPSGVTLHPFGFSVFYEYRGVSNTLPRLGFNTHAGALPEDFALNSLGDDVWIYSASNDVAGTLTGLRNGLTFGPAESGVSLGPIFNTGGMLAVAPLAVRSLGKDNPASVDEFRQGAGRVNSAARLSPLVITEVYYDPPPISFMKLDNVLHEFVEIYNCSTNPVSLYDPVNYGYADGRTNTWRLGGHVEVSFPTNFVIAPGQFVLAVNFSVTNAIAVNEFIHRFHPPPNVQMIGPYSPSSGANYGLGLTNEGGLIALEKPDVPKPPGHSQAGVVPYVPWDRVDYDDLPPWPTLAHGNTNIFDPSGIHTGYSLQRIVVENYGNDPTNWIATTPTPGQQPIRIEEFLSSSTGTSIRFRGWAGSSYAVEHAPRIDADNWTVFTNIPRQSLTGVRYATDTSASLPQARFYRIRAGE